MKIIFGMIPKKGLTFVIMLFVGFLGERALSTYFYDESFLEVAKLWRAVFVSGGIILAYFIIAFIYQSLRYSSALAQKSPEEIRDIISPERRKKKLSYRFELQTLSNEIAEITVYVQRRWLPNDARPTVEEFLDSLEYTDPRCSQCHSDFRTNYSGVTSYECPLPSCKNKQRIYKNDMFHMTQNAKAQFAGSVRRDFDHYWDVYVSTYLELTGGKPEEYQDTY